MIPKILVARLLMFISVVFYCCEDNGGANVSPQLNIIDLEALSQSKVFIKMSFNEYGSKRVIEHGYFWSEEAGASIEQGNKVVFSTTSSQHLYQDTVRNLKGNSTYYFRVYLINEENEIFYSEEKSVTTLTYILTNFAPLSASPDHTVRLYGNNFDASINVFIDEVPAAISASGTSYIDIVVPFGLDTDSVTISLEKDDITKTYPKKLHYKKGRWVKKTSLTDDLFYNNNFPKVITISDKGYLTGANDLVIFQYDPLLDAWSTYSEIPSSVGFAVRWFSIESNIYTHSSNTISKLDLNTGEWVGMGSGIPLTGWNPIGGVSFSFNGNGFIGLGSTSKIWRFVESLPGWEDITDFPGTGVSGPLTVTDNDGVYFIGNNETWKYYPTTFHWERKQDYPGKGKRFLAGFIFNGKLYVGCGGDYTMETFTSQYNDFWEYDPISDNWTQVADFIEPRIHPYSFVLHNISYVGGGHYVNCSGCGPQEKFDLWSFQLE